MIGPAIDLAASSTNTPRSHEVTQYSAPTGSARPYSDIRSTLLYVYKSDQEAEQEIRHWRRRTSSPTSQ
jgi:hypothetical protein